MEDQETKAKIVIEVGSILKMEEKDRESLISELKKSEPREENR